MSADEVPGLAGIARVSSLDDPVRRRLYDYVSGNDDPVSREDAAAAAGIGRTLAAYHLDKLAESGLLAISYARPPGRGGPGAGRPAKRYARAAGELSVSVPPRNYALLAGLLAEAVSTDGSGTVRAAVTSAARAAGRAIGGSATDLMSALREGGYEPAATSCGIELRNCPFHRIAREHTELVCGLNLDMVEGVLDGVGARRVRAVLDPRPGRCCVAIHDVPSARRSARRADTRR